MSDKELGKELGKEPGAFRTISEVAAELDLPQHVLRFWETKFSQIRPMKRSSGRRFYRPEDIGLVKAIRHMLYDQGYTIRGVQRVLKERGVRATLADAVAPDVPAPAEVSAPALTPEAPAFEEHDGNDDRRLHAFELDELRDIAEELRSCAQSLASARAKEPVRH